MKILKKVLHSSILEMLYFFMKTHVQYQQESRKKKILDLGWFVPLHQLYLWLYLPTPPLGQDMTQSQFLSGV